MSIYTEENLTKMSVHTLRVILRSEFGGVPGICNKNELISQILSIQGGADAPVRSTKGRKPLGEFITPINNEIVLYDPEAEKVEGTVKGIVELNENGYAFLRVKGEDCKYLSYFMPKNLVKKYGLRSGEEVEGISQYSAEMGGMKILAVNAINGKTPESERTTVVFSQLKPQYPQVKHRLTGDSPIIRALEVFCPLGKGQRCLVEDVTGKFGTEFTKALVNSLEESVKTFVIFVGAKPEDVSDIEITENKEIIFLPASSDSEEVLRIVNLTLERAKILTENGKDTAVIIDSLSAVISCYEDFEYVNKNDGGFIKTGVSKKKYARGIFSEGGCYGKGKSLTVVAVLNTAQDSYMASELSGIATSTVRLEGSDIFKRRGFVIDLGNSYTDKDELLLTDEEIAFADGEREKLGENANYCREIYRSLSK